MTQKSTVFVCSNCGYESAKWFGKCPSCNEWNSCYEEKLNVKVNGKKVNDKSFVEPVLLNDVKKQDVLRTTTGFEELDRVLRWRLGKRLFNFSTEENQVLVSLL
jgi:DNA repair protein RadA/Sms